MVYSRRRDNQPSRVWRLRKMQIEVPLVEGKIPYGVERAITSSGGDRQEQLATGKGVGREERMVEEIEVEA